MKHVLSIEVFFDFICPWCLIGQAHLQRALEQLRREQPEVEVSLHWRGVQLLPQMARTGQPFEAFYRKRLGSDEAVRLRQAQVRAAAEAAGVDIDFARISRMPNTADAHRLLQRAVALGSPEQAQALLARLFAAYFQQGKDLGDPITLLHIARACGLEPAQVADCLRGDASPFIGANDRAADGVPCFRFNQRLRVSGAQPVAVLLQAMGDALEEAAPA
ncbi:MULTISPECIES: DsbA family oxidoreductase [Pseudomonas]|uniref:DsbA family oxidoreductase n=1 Tax=Pseudomonas TaxID=286 RepID=UPI000C29A3B4|nr:MULTISPECIES: DsbA family oxidoreductase [Pseudomonas]MBF4209701.1 DsbA family oxidoreductase [Pseudomonas donghuensis]MCP6697983.1 DsbA family oxidoreductase [Pseudomonas donghuensis]PJY93915.1 disulfide bond formation protein DsbA [Pseudomonas donghuensis]QHF28706.1 disulfide bond formation protein DsbA [Pseudomonas sp. R32]UVL31935.1 DsbA family oxidoreductase [Pseudomonas donghuensis]